MRFVPGRFRAYPWTNFAQIFSPGKSPGYDLPGHLDRGVPVSQLAAFRRSHYAGI